jgi:hypothetical protein
MRNKSKKSSIEVVKIKGSAVNTKIVGYCHEREMFVFTQLVDSDKSETKFFFYDCADIEYYYSRETLDKAVNMFIPSVLV